MIGALTSRGVKATALLATLLAWCAVADAQDSAEQNVFFAGSGAGPAKPAGKLQERMVDKTKGNAVIVVVNCNVYKDVKFEEKERHTRIYDDIHAIFGKFTATGKTECWRRYTHTLKYTRSTLTVTAVGKDEADTAKTTVVTGPKDHIYIGLDLPVTQRKTLKYDSKTQSLQPQNENPQLYFSFNWYFGDLAAPQLAPFYSYERLSFKTFLLADSRPLDSYGVGLGYQLPKFDVIDLSPINLFAGHFWTKQDAISSSGEPLKNQSTARDWRFGITYDVGSGLKWIKN